MMVMKDILFDSDCKKW